MKQRGAVQQAIRVVGICGSLRPASFTRQALRISLRGAEEFGAETRLIDLANYSLNFCDGKEDESSYPADVFRLRSEVRAADGLILGTPQYHGSFSGVLKNAMDLMGFDEFEGKMLGLVGVSGGAAGAFEALNHLRSVGRALHAWVIPEQVSVTEAWKWFDARGNLKEAGAEKRLLEVGRQVARFARLHKWEQQEFLKCWETAVENPGAESKEKPDATEAPKKDKQS